MQRTKTPTFRPTVWPAEPPRTPRVTQYRLAPDNRTGGLKLMEATGEVDLPPDFVLQEMLGLTVTSSQDVIDLSAAWGLLAPPGDEPFHYLPGDEPVSVVRDVEQWGPYSRHVVHPGAVEMHLRVAQALARHLLVYLEGGSEASLLEAWAQDGMQVPDSAAQAWLWWEGYMNAGLQAFTVHVRAVEGTESLLTRPNPNLYNACCLQLAQYLATDQEVMRCANDRCRKPFTRQRGRARDDYGQHRSRGVLYCSHLCAKAQSERDRRRRRAGEKTKGDR